MDIDLVDIALIALFIWAFWGASLRRLIRPARVNLDPIPDDFTPRIVSNDDETGGVLVKLGNTPNYFLYREEAALRLPQVRDERVR